MSINHALLKVYTDVVNQNLEALTILCSDFVANFAS